MKIITITINKVLVGNCVGSSTSTRVSLTTLNIKFTCFSFNEFSTGTLIINDPSNKSGAFAGTSIYVEIEALPKGVKSPDKAIQALQ